MNDEQVVCKKCGSIYSLRKESVPYRDQDYINCSVCGDKLYSWNEAKTYYETLVEKKENHLK